MTNEPSPVLREEVLREMFLFLSSCEQDYPYGVPVRFIEEASSRASQGVARHEELQRDPSPVRFQSGKVLRAQIALIASDVSAETSLFSLNLQGLLESIILRGLKLETDEVYVANTERCYSPEGILQHASADLVREAVHSELKQAQVRIAVLCGERVAQSFSSVGFLERGWHSAPSDDLRYFVTHDLSEVHTSQAKKKEFWHDLQLVMNELELY